MDASVSARLGSRQHGRRRSTAAGIRQGPTPGDVLKIEKRAPALRFASRFHHGEGDEDEDEDGENGGLSRTRESRKRPIEDGDRGHATSCLLGASEKARVVGNARKGGKRTGRRNKNRIDRRDEKDASSGRADAYGCSITRSLVFDFSPSLRIGGFLEFHRASGTESAATPARFSKRERIRMQLR